jgi:hypothetical protein
MYGINSASICDKAFNLIHEAMAEVAEIQIDNNMTEDSMNAINEIIEFIWQYPDPMKVIITSCIASIEQGIYNSFMDEMEDRLPANQVVVIKDALDFYSDRCYVLSDSDMEVFWAQLYAKFPPPGDIVNV